MQATLDRPRLLAQALRDLADGELFEVAQQHHFEVAALLVLQKNFQALLEGADK